MHRILIRNMQEITRKCYKCNKIGHKSAECKSKSKRRKQCAGYYVCECSICWITRIDAMVRVWNSGARSHMCHDKKKFHELDTNKKCNVHIATEHTVESGGTGDVKMKVTLKDRKVNDIKLRDTILVPKFRSNLLSVSRMTDNGYTVTFKKRRV